MVDTTHLKLFLPTPNYPMSDVKRCLTDNFKKISDFAEVPVISWGQPLPQSGDYEVGSRVYQNGDGGIILGSSYVLVCKDENWGWHWRPIQAKLSPWVNLTNNVFNAGTPFVTSTTYPLALAFDNRGQIWWRGAIQYTGGATIPPALDYSVFKALAAGIKPSSPVAQFLPGNPVSGGATGVLAYIGGYFQLQPNGTSVVTVTNTDTNTVRLWFTAMTYWAAEAYDTGA